MTTLIYRGGATLTFGSGSGRQIVKRGESFEVGEELAAILLADPAVEGYEAPAVSADVPREAPEATAVPTKAELLKAATALGLKLPARSTNDHITAAIAAEHARLADETAAALAAATVSDSGEGAQEGDSTSADDPDASATGEADTPPSNSGAITLGDLPESAKVGA